MGQSRLNSINRVEVRKLKKVCDFRLLVVIVTRGKKFGKI